MVGSVLDKDNIANAIKGQDAVISCLGGDDNNKSTILTYMIKIVVDGMNESSVKRIAYIATAGIENEMPGLLAKILVSLLYKNVIDDHKNVANYIKKSNLEYTIAIPLSLVDGDLTKSYRKTTEGIPRGGRNISRKDVAHFLLDSIENDTHVNESIGLAY